jgi:ABC-type uncharacterized transport system involved in gliding motility auxiliary subunit
MKEMSRVAGIVGALALVVGGITYLFQERFSPWVIAFLAAGAALIIVFLALNFGLVIKALGKRATVYGLNLIVSSLVVLAILVVVQLIFSQNKWLNRRFDLTEAKMYSISEQSIKILKSLHRDVKVTAFYRDAPDKDSMDQLLEVYSRYSPRFSYELLDPDRSPQKAEQLDVKSYNTAVVQCGDKKEELSFARPDEEALTNALIKVTRETEKVIYFTTGHGEKSIDDSERLGMSNFKTAVEKAAYKVKEILVARERGGIPAECSALVVAGPQTGFYQFELDQVDQYLQEGGRVLFMLDPEKAPGMAAFLDKYGVIVGNDYVLDPNPLSQFLGGDYLSPLITDYSGTHEITRGFNFATLVSRARSTRVKDGLASGISGEWIAQASPQSWGETNLALLNNANQARYDPTSDVRGPVPVAVAMTIDFDARQSSETSPEEEPAKREARLVVIGDSDMGANVYLRPENKNLLLNAISWLVEEEDLISVMPKQRKSSPMMLSRTQQKVLFIVPVFFVPGGVVLAGGCVYFYRRRYR